MKLIRSNFDSINYDLVYQLNLEENLLSKIVSENINNILLTRKKRQIDLYNLLTVRSSKILFKTNTNRTHLLIQRGNFPLKQE